MARPWRGVVEEYRDWLPVDDDTPVVTLGEGGTPLVHSTWLSGVVHGDVWLKVEGDKRLYRYAHSESASGYRRPPAPPAIGHN